MSDFTQTMKEWTRMCRSHNDEPDPCELCKLGHNGELCMAVFEAADVGEPDYAHIENVVARWAEEHPEPQYPTWGEWFEKQGELTADWRDIRVVRTAEWRDINAVRDGGTGIIGLFYQRIPAEIAEKLGIEPKEG